MFSITKIEAVNFRNLGSVTIEPEPGEKITALNGPSGSGKSSIVHAIVWALFGVNPAGVKQSDLRRQGTSGANKDECSVAVTLEHAGDTITVTRRLTGSKDLVKASIVVNDVAITDLKASPAVEWIKKRLNLTADEFLTAYVVRQKELDSLVTDRPAERKESIERLAGLTSLSDAVDAARAAARDAQSTLTALQGTALDVSAAEQDLTDAREALESEQTAANEHDEAATQREQRADAAEQHATEIREQWDAGEELRRLDRDAQHEKELAEQASTQADAELKRAEEDAAGGDEASVSAAEGAHKQAQEALDAASTTNREIQDAITAEATAKANATSATTQAGKDATAVQSAREALQQAQARVSEFPADLDTQRETLAEKVRAAADRMSVLQAEGTRLNKAIEALQDAADAACPTCAQSLPDPHALITSFTNDRDGLRADYTSAQEEHRQATEALAGLDALIDQRKTAAAKVDTCQEDLNKQVEAAQASQQEADDRTDTWNAAQEALETLGPLVDTTALAQAVTTAQNAYTAAVKARDAAAGLGAVRKAAEKARTRLTEATTKARETAKEAAAATITAEQVQDAEQQARQARKDATQARDDHKQTAANVALKQQAVDTAEANLQRARQSQEMLDAAATAAEQSATVVSATENYRDARRFALLPELAAETTDLLDEMTAGRYVAVNFDEQFTPVVTDNIGEARSVGMLSGGEQSVVALAMRLAIGRIIAGSAGQEGILVLDEVLSAQDSDRRRDVLNAIGSLGGRQIVMINHLPEAIDMADVTYEFSVTDGVGAASRLDDAGSTIEHLEAVVA